MKQHAVLPFYAIALLLLICTTFISCNKEPDEVNVTLQFSTHEVTFDTIFTSVGSATQKFTAFNPSNHDVDVAITLGNGGNSYYSMNVNGVAGAHIPEMTIPAKDSVFVFVKVNINPGMQNTPFLVSDSIMFRTPNKEQKVNLVAYGQDAKFIIADSGPETMRYKVVAGANEHVTWTNEKPIVVYGWAVVDSLGTLTIEPGTKVYFHHNSGLWVYRFGNMSVNGTTEEPILFRGDRLEEWYDEDYSQWNRIWINEGGDVSINNANISNAYIGIQVEPLPTSQGILITDDVVNIENTTIKNTLNSALLVRYSNVNITNSLIYNNGSCGVQFEGGNLNVKHTTFYNFFSQGKRENPIVYVSNFSNVYQLAYASTALFVNNIVYGNIENEFLLHQSEEATLEIAVENCLIKTNETSPSYFQNCLFNLDPLFQDRLERNFELTAESPAINAGKENIGVILDITGKTRTGIPDLGCYEFE